MKKIYLFGASFLLCLTSLAQPTITSNSNPSIGQSFSYLRFTWDGNPGTTGANQSWDFSALSGQALAMSYIDPSTAPSASSFGAANICVNAASQVYQFNNNTSSAQEIIGFYTASGTTVYSDPEKIMEFPCTYQTTWNDNLSGTISTGFTRAGTVSGDADSYGTLILPSGTYNNVLRVKIVEDYEDSYQGTPIYMTLNTIYMFYLEGQHSPILALTHSNTAGQSTYYGNYMDNPVLGTNTIEEENLKIYPNPVKEVLNFSIPQTIESNYNVEIYSMTGQQVLNYSKPISTVDVSDFDSGVYLVILTNGDTVIREKIVKH
ncbi:MAG: T9SS type A sorting domain-containing protein [Crocinitomicaceae bacterium]